MNRRGLRYLVVLGLLLFSQGAMASCNGVVQKHAHIQWSNPANIVSPNKMWQLEVHPDLTSDENRSQIFLRRCSDEKFFNLFTLERNAEVYWGGGDGHLLVIDQPTTDVSKLILIDTKSLFDTKKSLSYLDLNNEIQGDVKRRLGAARHIEFYLLNFVEWDDGTLVLGVGGTTSSGANGPMTPYCYGVRLDSNTSSVKNLISADDLRSRFNNASCVVFP